MSIDPRVHRRFLDYLDLHVYFSKKKPLSMPDFVERDTIYFSLLAKGDERDDEEDVVFAAITNELHRD